MVIRTKFPHNYNISFKHKESMYELYKLKNSREQKTVNKIFSKK